MHVPLPCAKTAARATDKIKPGPRGLGGSTCPVQMLGIGFIMTVPHRPDGSLTHTPTYLTTHSRGREENLTRSSSWPPAIPKQLVCGPLAIYNHN